MSLGEELRSRNFSMYPDLALLYRNLLTLLAFSRHLWTMVSLLRYLPTLYAFASLNTVAGEHRAH